MRRLLLCACLAGWMLPVSAEEPPTPASAVVERPLGLREAVETALLTNLKTKQSKERIREAEGRIEQAYSTLYPQIRFVSSQFNRTVNLASQGLAGGGIALPIPTVVGPFWSFDSRVQFAYSIIDPASAWRRRGADVERAIAFVDDAYQRQAVETMVSLDYVNLLSARNSETVAIADRDVAEKLLKLAKDQQNAGVAAGVDVVRAQSQLAEKILRLSTAHDQVLRSSLELQRFVGIPMGGMIRPTDDLFPADVTLPTQEEALKIGQEKRLDVVLLRRKADRLNFLLSAAKADNSPTLSFSADYGFSGNTPWDNTYGTHNIGLTFNVPIFDGGLADGKVEEAKSQLAQANMNTHDQEIQVDQEVRQAYLRIELSRQQMVTAKAGREFAERDLKMSTDRFRAGLGTSVEIATAQANLSRAEDAEVQAKVQYNLGLVQLSAAVGSPDMVLEIYHIQPLDPARRKTQ